MLKAGTGLIGTTVEHSPSVLLSVLTKLVLLIFTPSTLILFLFLSIPVSLFIPPFSLPTNVYPLCLSGFILWVPAWCSDVLSPAGQFLHVANRL